MEPLKTFGAHPLFFYVVHIALLNAIAAGLMIGLYGQPTGFANGAFQLPPGYTPSLAVVYAAWAGALALMWALCRAYERTRSASAGLAR